MSVDKDSRRQLAAWSAQTLATEYQLGHVMVLIINEDPDNHGHLELDACGHAHTAWSEEGGAKIIRFAERLSKMVKALTEEMAHEMRLTIIERPDLEIQTPGGRPKA